jgi:hypothetical protein
MDHVVSGPAEPDRIDLAELRRTPLRQLPPERVRSVVESIVRTDGQRTTVDVAAFNSSI